MPQLQFATAADMHQTRGQAKEFGKGELRGGGGMEQKKIDKKGNQEAGRKTVGEIERQAGRETDS